jgi:hypothetical protein
VLVICNAVILSGWSGSCQALSRVSRINVSPHDSEVLLLQRESITSAVMLNWNWVGLGRVGWQLNGETLLYTKSGQVHFHLIIAGLVFVSLGQVKA